MSRDLFNKHPADALSAGPGFGALPRPVQRVPVCLRLYVRTVLFPRAGPSELLAVKNMHIVSLDSRSSLAFQKCSCRIHSGTHCECASVPAALPHYPIDLNERNRAAILKNDFQSTPCNFCSVGGSPFSRG